jgi:hypothetical protein
MKLLAFDIINNISANSDLNWDTDSMLDIVCAFIDNKGMNDEFKAFVAEIADTEKNTEEALSHGIDMDDDIEVDKGENLYNDPMNGRAV